MSELQRPEGVQQNSSVDHLINDGKIRNKFKFEDDSKRAAQDLATIVSEVAVKKLGGKKGKRSYELKFQVLLRKNSDEDNIRWVTIVTKKQDLQTSLKCVKAFQGLARHLSTGTYDKHFSTTKSVGMQLFEIGTWQKKGGTGKYALRIKREEADGNPRDPVWVTWRIHPQSFYGGVPSLPHDDSDPKENKLTPSEIFVTYYEKAAVCDLESQLPVKAGFWANAREAILWKNVKRSGAEALTSTIPFSTKWTSFVDTFSVRLEKEEEVHQWLIDHPEAQRRVHQQFEQYIAEQKQQPHKLMNDTERFLGFGYTPPGHEPPNNGENDNVTPISLNSYQDDHASEREGEEEEEPLVNNNRTLQS